MAKPLVLKFGGTDFPFTLCKVERADLYGFIETEALDERGRKCMLATLADDGRSIIASGGSALVTLTPEGHWIEKKALIPTDNQGNRIAPVGSSYAAPVLLETVATIDDYLSHNIRAVYQITCDADFSGLLTELKNGTIYQFPYSFRGGLEPDTAFMLMAADGTPFIAIGTPTKLEFVGFDQTAAIVGDEDSGDEEEDSLDFSMIQEISMATINLSNSNGRDAVVGSQSCVKPMKVRWLDDKGRQAQSARVMKSHLSRDIAALEAQAGGRDKVAGALIAGDPEIDLENFGAVLKETSRVYVDPDGKIVHKVKQFEVVKNPDGTERERRPKKVAQSNCSGETPLKWTGKMMKKKDVYNKFVFSGKRQIVHVNGLTYDFLFNMAKELEETESLMLLGAGPKGTHPLVLQRGGQQYRGFLEGRTQGDKYCLILHLSNLELKKVEQGQ